MDTAVDLWIRVGTLLSEVEHAPRVGCPDSFVPAVEELTTLRRSISASDRQITLIGASGTGKTSVLNSLIGVSLLPVHAARGYQATIRVTFGEAPAAEVERDDRVESVSLDDIPRLLETDSSIREVRLAFPLPLLQSGWSLVDTPGGEYDGRALQELGRSELALVVLAADQILSARERDITERVNRMLGGNVMFVINRIDLVDSTELEDVLTWTRRSLRDTGNALVGRGTIHVHTERAKGGAERLRSHLLHVTSGTAGERVAVLARLTRLRRSLASLLDAAAKGLEVAERSASHVRAAEEGANSRERAARLAAIRGSRRHLKALRTAGLEPFTSRFLQRSLESLRTVVEESDDRPSRLHIPYETPLARYIDEVNEQVQISALDAGISLPQFNLESWAMHAEVDTPLHPWSDIPSRLGDVLTRPLDGGTTGRDAGNTLGRWIGSNVLRVDVERETLTRGEALLRAALPSLQSETRKRLRACDTALAEAERYFQDWSPISSELRDLDDARLFYTTFIAWATYLRGNVELVIQDVLDG